MATQAYMGSATVIKRLLRMENGVRKAARVFLFLDRAAAVEIIADLPLALIAVITREMAILRAEIQDFEEERRQLEGELGALAEVINFSPINTQGASELNFLNQLSEDGQKAMASEAAAEGGQSFLAAIVANAPAEIAFNMIGALPTQFERKALTEEMTRLKAANRDWIEDARSLAQKCRELESAPKEARKAGNAIAASVPKTLKRRGATIRLSDLEDTEKTMSLAEAIAEISDQGGPRLVQLALAALSDEQLAGSLLTGDSVSKALLLGNLSRNRQASVAELAEGIEADIEAAPRQQALLVARLMRASNELLGRSGA